MSCPYTKCHVSACHLNRAWNSIGAQGGIQNRCIRSKHAMRNRRRIYLAIPNRTVCMNICMFGFVFLFPGGVSYLIYVFSAIRLFPVWRCSLSSMHVQYFHGMGVRTAHDTTIFDKCTHEHAQAQIHSNYIFHRNKSFDAWWYAWAACFLQKSSMLRTIYVHMVTPIYDRSQAGAMPGLLLFHVVSMRGLSRITMMRFTFHVNIMYSITLFEASSINIFFHGIA